MRAKQARLAGGVVSAGLALLVLVLVPGAGAAAPGERQGDPPSRLRSGPIAVVRMADDPWDRFRPARMTIVRGDRVRWVNVGEVTHTATGDGWDSGSVAPGETYGRRFRRLGTFDYRCVIHPEMTGTVTVERPS